MFTDIETYLRYYEGLHKRTVRDVAALPPEAAGYVPEQGEDENGWTIGEIVRHLAASRLYFSRAYRGEGWIFDWPTRVVESQADWIPVLEETWGDYKSHLIDTPPEFLTRRVEMIDTDGTLAGWRILMMCLEHEVHHRSQIDTYAGLNGWEPPQIYGRSAEQVGAERERQQAKQASGDN
jgi:uncharacterized damage-inducible protein DinB